MIDKNSPSVGQMPVQEKTVEHLFVRIIQCTNKTWTQHWPHLQLLFHHHLRKYGIGVNIGGGHHPDGFRVWMVKVSSPLRKLSSNCWSEPDNRVTKHRQKLTAVVTHSSLSSTPIVVLSATTRKFVKATDSARSCDLYRAIRGLASLFSISKCQSFVWHCKTFVKQHFDKAYPLYARASCRNALIVASMLELTTAATNTPKKVNKIKTAGDRTHRISCRHCRVS